MMKPTMTLVLNFLQRAKVVAEGPLVVVNKSKGAIHENLKGLSTKNHRLERLSLSKSLMGL